MGLNLFRVIACYLKPILPATVEAAEAFLQIEPLMWDDAKTPLNGHTIGKFKPLMTRVDPKQIEGVIEDSKEDLAASEQVAEPVKASGPLADDPIGDTIEFDDFAKLDLRIARIVKAATCRGRRQTAATDTGYRR